MGKQTIEHGDCAAPEPVQPSGAPYDLQQIAESMGEPVVPVLMVTGPSWAAESSVKGWRVQNDTLSNFVGLFRGYRVEPGLWEAVFNGRVSPVDLLPGDDEDF